MQTHTFDQLASVDIARCELKCDCVALRIVLDLRVGSYLEAFLMHIPSPR